MKVSLRKFWIVLIAAFSALQAQAQYGLGLTGMHRFQASQAYNPAWIAEDEFSKFRVGGNAGLWLGNTHVTPGGIIGDSGYISLDARNRVIDQLGKNEVINFGTRLELANVNVKIKAWTWAFSLSEYNLFSAGFNNPHTAGLILLGNKPYAGQTVSDEGIYARLYHVRELGAGYGFKTGDLGFGIRLKLLQGLNLLDVLNVDYSLYTDSLGWELDITADYDIHSTYNKGRASLTRTQGMGAAIDVGLTYQLNERMNIDVSILDLGMMSWKTKQFAKSVNVQDFEGIEVSSLFASDIPEQIEEEVDSLRDLLIPDSVDTRRNMSTPARINVGLEYELNEKSGLGYRLIYAPLRHSYRTRLPLLSVTYYRELFTDFRLCAGAYGGGTDLFGFSLSGSYRIKFGDKSLDLLASGDNLLGFLNGVGRGFSVMGAVGFNW